MTDQKQMLIIGGTGKTGGRVVEHLKKSGHAYRLGTPDSDIPFDWYNESTWQNALKNVSSAYVVFYPDLAVPDAPSIVARFVDAAKNAQLEHLVLLSGRGEEAAHVSEDLVKESGLPWTVVRCSWFMQNFSENFLLDDIVRRQIALPVSPDIAEPFVSANDIADVVFAALTDPKHRGQLYELTGPELLTFPEISRRIGAALGEDIQFTQLQPEEYVQILRDARLPEGVISLMDYLFKEVLDGHNSVLTDGVQRALGRAPEGFDSYIAKTLETGVWQAK